MKKIFLALVAVALFASAPAFASNHCGCDKTCSSKCKSEGKCTCKDCDKEKCECDKK